MVRTKADSVPGTYRKVVAARAPRKVLGSSTSATNSTPVSSRKEHVLCNLITQMMKKNRTFSFIFK
ncbi:PCNA-associated factor isoform X2 [Rhinopithecus roxellana]|uniref:PCNA-associated factor n=2 Tax=Rhinopithecus TaxID=542827 RepID=A0A2K6L2N3_RHIBE|nr:PCNA-associated factor isoform X2 [Rhinopithecus roxellana]XP_017740629.1 PREDICTED: PCNA-associated factor [Rhinopithecus bieti]XP_033045680.1 PCNA-associated factor isoform X2 [Trachypithecus francoisi]